MSTIPPPLPTDATLDIEAVYAAAEAATAGPWIAKTPQHLPWEVWDDSGDIAVADIPRHTLANYKGDIAFIAAARTVVPALCRLLAESRAETARWRAAVQFIRDQYPADVFTSPAGIMARKVCDNITEQAAKG